MIIKLRKYNEVRELLMANRVTGSQGHVSYWDKGQEASVTRVAVHMGVKGTEMRTRHRGTYNQPLSWSEDRYTYKHCRAINKV